ncbi:MAG TPA: CHAT domain-containing protein [Thermoanaerobaculia bacterium]|nr:CHAT domain-containing protein [Thermoanaerobaculia bacterium]
MAVLATVVTVFGSHGRSNEHTSTSILAELAVADGYRIVEPRMSIPLPYAAFRLVTEREHIGALMRGNPSLLIDVHNRTAQHERALTNLVLGRWDEAVKLFETYSPMADPVDVSTAFYMRGIASGSLSDLAKAWNALGSAGNSAEVTFNRALILEQLSDFDAATAEWQRYLAKDSQSDWALEARRHLAATRATSVPAAWQKDKTVLLQAATAGREETVRRLAQRYALAARRMVENELLPAWGDARARGDLATAEQKLFAARLIVAQRPAQEERVLATAIAEIDAIREQPGVVKLAAAYRIYGEGAVALEVVDHEAALTSFSRALELAGPRSPTFDAIVAPAIATAHYRHYDHAAAESVIAATRSRYGHQLDQFLTLAARLDWLEGLIRVARGDPSGALRSYQRALVVYDRLGEEEHRAAQHVNQADSYNIVGDEERAGAHLREALKHASKAEDPRRLLGILKVAAIFMMDNVGPAPAIVLLDRAVPLAKSTTEPMRIADMLVFRSPVLTRAGRRAEALRDIDDALRLMPQIPDEPTRQRLLADAKTAEAFAYRDFDDRRVVDSLTSALELFRTLGMRVFFVQLLLERGRAYTRLGNLRAAEQDFRRGIDELEARRDIMGDADLRISYLDRADRVFVDLAQLLLSRGQVEEAFDFLERSRARELLDRTSGRAVRPMPSIDIATRLPEDTILVTHTLSSDTLITFIVSRSGVRATAKRVEPSHVSALVSAIADGFKSELPQSALRELGRLLIDDAGLAPGRRVVFVPDHALRSVPFAALRTASGEYAIERQAIAIAPSATLLVRTLGAASAARAATSILVLASPESPVGFDLEPLPRVHNEARRVAARYRTSRIVLGSDREAEAILPLSRAYDVLHFAGHSVVDLRTPRRSALLVGTSGRITAGQIETEDLSHLALVVLGGCNTNLGRSYRSEGVMSLARSFIVAGVPAVVGTVAKIEDGDAERLLDWFHERYATHGDAMEALQDTQLRMLRSGNTRMAEPARWSSFQVIQRIERERR